MTSLSQRRLLVVGFSIFISLDTDGLHRLALGEWGGGSRRTGTNDLFLPQGRRAAWVCKLRRPRVLGRWRDSTTSLGWRAGWVNFPCIGSEGSVADRSGGTLRGSKNCDVTYASKTPSSGPFILLTGIWRTWIPRGTVVSRPAWPRQKQATLFLDLQAYAWHGLFLKKAMSSQDPWRQLYQNPGIGTLR
jgi:hypothetical protein